ncbi:MAG TPA: GNAT family N-acetyltransferase [Lachnospiraceae bacterium]|nr:GNAT family N-acetyltransferase [Lachnospiraceae bacterium]
MNNLLLVFPSEEMEIKALEFKRDFFDNGEKTINGSYKLDMDRYTYSEWLQIIRDNLDKDKANPKFGFSHTLFAINEDKKIIGIVNFRHVLTDFYKNSGHIGYSVRPLERKKGYATEILSQTLDYAKKQGLSEVFLVCKRDNEASKKTIIKNNGLLIRTFLDSEIEYQEYRIDI